MKLLNSIFSHKYFTNFVSQILFKFIVEEHGYIYGLLLIFQQFKSIVENKSGYVMKTLVTNKVGEFTSNHFDYYFKRNGI